MLLEFSDLLFFCNTPEGILVRLNVVFSLFSTFANDVIDLAGVHTFHEGVHHGNSIRCDFTENDIVLVFLVWLFLIVSRGLNAQEPNCLVLDFLDITSCEEQNGILSTCILHVISLSLLLHLVVDEDFR